MIVLGEAAYRRYAPTGVCSGSGHKAPPTNQTIPLPKDTPRSPRLRVSFNHASQAPFQVSTPSMSSTLSTWSTLPSRLLPVVVIGIELYMGGAHTDDLPDTHENIPLLPFLWLFALFLQCGECFD